MWDSSGGTDTARTDIQDFYPPYEEYIVAYEGCTAVSVVCCPFACGFM